MSILDEIMPAESVPSQPNTTVFINGALAFTPRTIQKPMNNGILINTITTANTEVMHYVVGNVEGMVYHMFNAKLGLPLVDVLAMAYRNVFMWIRPQGPNGIYYDVFPNRDRVLTHLGYTIREAVGSDADAKMIAPYHDERLLEINKGAEAFLYDIRRTYDSGKDRLTTVIMALPAAIAELSVDELYEDGFATTIRHTPAWVDPGDFLPGVWTPDPNAEDGVKPVDEFHPENIPA